MADPNYLYHLVASKGYEVLLYEFRLFQGGVRKQVICAFDAARNQEFPLCTKVRCKRLTQAEVEALVNRLPARS